MGNIKLLCFLTVIELELDLCDFSVFAFDATSAALSIHITKHTI